MGKNETLFTLQVLQVLTIHLPREILVFYFLKITVLLHNFQNDSDDFKVEGLMDRLGEGRGGGS